jgi:hypothetical protein
MENIVGDVIGNALGLIVVVAVVAFAAGWFLGGRSK